MKICISFFYRTELRDLGDCIELNRPDESLKTHGVMFV